MDANQVWKVAQGLEGIALRRWTKGDQAGELFTFRIRDAGRGPAIAFFRDGREVKSASFDRFRRFYDEWRRGHRSPDLFQNDGPLRSEAQVARFLIPVFELAGGSEGVKQRREKSAKAASATVKRRHAALSASGLARATISHLEFDARLRKLVPNSDASRPFMCSSDPLAAEIFIVALNPGTDTPFWPFWNGRVFDKVAWLQEFQLRHNGQFKKTRRYLERLIDGLKGVSYLETNLYPYPSRQFDVLPREHAKTDVFDFLTTTIRPRVMFILGKKTIEYVCDRAKIARLPKDESFTTITWSDATIDVMADNHFAIRNKYWDDAKVDRIASALKDRCLRCRTRAGAGPLAD